LGRLSEDQVWTRLAGLRGWQLRDGRIWKQYVFDAFGAAIAFVNRVASLAESADHHPDILVEYDKVTLTLSSHDVGGLSERDFSLALAIDA
jgi:4a-hydroxytetrahydrobiopterin dehydratase